ncbi:diguanylate cyclase [Undibacterium jejuense]|uniref:Diguanylate cyclase n=1 Tax=Undibacterium jejuense TaxID=1344949 RepID=A0A923HLA3_9BURK|nr:diguanylate cyclase [Undibacterium jejuense]MBC3863792.1 diguanylate cyclase [Undibacterium jejuense]
MKLLKCLLSLSLLLIQLCPCFTPSVYALEKVSLQLKWTHEFQFAGYYAAKEKGFYQQAGLDVDIREADPSLDVNNEVLRGHTNFGVGTSSLILERKAGQPAVVLAVIFQHSPQIIVIRNGLPAQSVHDLKGKRLMLEPQSEELVAYLKAEGIPLNSISLQKHSFDVQDLVDGLTDAMSAYSFSEPYYLDQAKFDYQAFTPRSDGIDFYGDNLFTSEAEINQHPERVKAFRDASLRGWDYAITHQDEIIDLILKKYPNKNRPNTREFLRFEADKISELMRSDLLATGYMNPGRWRHIADTYADLGMLPKNFPLDNLLYEPNPAINFKLIYSIITVTLLFACVAGVITFYILRVNRRLAQSLDELRAGALKLKLLSMAIEHSPTSVIITGPDTRIQYVNSQFTKETGYSADDAYGKTPRILQSGLTRVETYQDMWADLSQGKLWKGELINRRKSGEVYWEEAHISPVNDENGKLTHYIAVKLDITERKHTSDRLVHMAHHDGLTNLPNRILFFERVEQGLALARRNHTKLALMFIDLDRFKPINDRFGHAVGDAILQEAAKRMLECVREADTVGRIGGDEFIGLMLDIGDHENAEAVATKICNALSIAFNVSGDIHQLSASIGVAVYPEHGHDEISLAKSADLAMYCAKASGRNNVKVFQSDMKKMSFER